MNLRARASITCSRSYSVKQALQATDSIIRKVADILIRNEPEGLLQPQMQKPSPSTLKPGAKLPILLELAMEEKKSKLGEAVKRSPYQELTPITIRLLCEDTIRRYAMRKCQNPKCGKALPTRATVRRKYCNDKCRFEHWAQENRNAGPGGK